MTDEDVVARVAALLGISYHRSDRGAARGWKPCFVFHMKGGRAVEWMRKLRPLMGIRRQAQIDAALQGYIPVRAPLSEKVRQQIVQALQEGVRAVDLADKFKISREHVYRLARNYGGQCTMDVRRIVAPQ